MRKNESMPFSLKKRVLEACFMAAILYGSESWFTDSLVLVEKYYHAAIKMVLGVRHSTPNLLCLLEIGLPDMATFVLERRDLITSTREEPLWKIYELCKAQNTKGSQFLNDALYCNGILRTEAREKMAAACRERALTATRYSTYLPLNPRLD